MLLPQNDIDLLDGGLKMLQNLPFVLRKELDDYSRKRSIPENCMDRDWVVNELLRLEKRDQAVLSFWRQSVPEKPTAPVQSNKPAAPKANHLPPTAALPVDADLTPMQIRGDPGASRQLLTQLKPSADPILPLTAERTFMPVHLIGTVSQLEMAGSSKFPSRVTTVVNTVVWLIRLPW